MGIGDVVAASMQPTDPNVLDAVTIDMENIQEEYIRLPALIAFWYEQYAGAKHRLAMAKMDRDTKRAQLTYSVREELVAQGSKRPAVATVDSYVDSMPEWHAAKSAHISAETETQVITGILESLRVKRDMLVSLGAHMRQELATVGVVS